ncbi:MAG: phytanoyl-CoA dioxygenase family protein [Proteobacteria bacterium]|nr:phytanoyl-CoA dioxygenase family protein [Pseudomonadota bacterium]
MGICAEQRRQFEERGWFHLGPVFSAEELAELRSEYDRALTNPLRIGEQGKSPFEYSPLLHLRSPVLLRYATSPQLVEAAVDLLGPDVRLYWDQAVSKPAGAESDVPWHQDNGYTPVEPEEYVTFTVAIDATRVENGCLWIQPGSHRDGVQPHRRTDTLFYRGYDGDDPGVPVEQEEGDVLAFSSLTMHRSGANRSAGPRRSWVIQFCHGHACNQKTRVPFDDRLLVARDGVVLEEPVREREFDWKALLDAGQATS